MFRVCIHCGYDLTGAGPGRAVLCPECGRVDHGDRRAPMAMVYWKLWGFAAVVAGLGMWWWTNLCWTTTGWGQAGAIMIGFPVGAVIGGGSGLLGLISVGSVSAIVERDRRPSARWVWISGLIGIIGGAVVCGGVALMIAWYAVLTRPSTGGC